MNKIILKGRVGQDPQITQVGDTFVANISLATSEKYTNRNGEKVEQTEWHRLALWGPKATLAEQYIRKGSELLIEGAVQYRDDKKETTTSGYPVKRTTIRVDQVYFCGSRNSSTATTASDEGEYYPEPGSDG